MQSPYGRVISARLNEDEIASLNRYLTRNNYSSLAEFLRATLKANTSNATLDQIVDKLARIVDNLEVSGPRGTRTLDQLLRRQPFYPS